MKSPNGYTDADYERDRRMDHEAERRTIYRVKYYDRRTSWLGRGVQVRAFKKLEDAERFASANQLYCWPCVVEICEM